MMLLTFVAFLALMAANSCGARQMTTAGGYCAFPFTYRGKVYNSCTTTRHNRPWCATAPSYVREKMWGNCAGFTSSGVKTTSGEYCAFPFTYGNVVYKSCTTKNSNRPWCSTTVNYNKDQKRGNCAGFASSGVKTVSGEYCVFPFTYYGTVYNSCTTKNRNKPWCATTANYNKDYKSGACKGYHSGKKTTSGENCAFPFVYRGYTYNTCIGRYHNNLWCATTTNYDKDGKWGNCA